MDKLPELPEPFRYPEGDVSFCECGGMPGGKCLKCHPLTFYMDAQMRAYGAACRQAALEEAARIAANMPACPFDGPTNLEPHEPCPVCGDRGDDLDAPSHCRSAAAAIRQAKAQPAP